MEDRNFGEKRDGEWEVKKKEKVGGQASVGLGRGGEACWEVSDISRFQVLGLVLHTSSLI